MKNNLDFKLLDLRQETFGHWYEVLISAGISSEYLVNKHGPCPFCGGKDRWRWDDKNGTGSGFCNQCGAGDGFYLIAKALGLSLKSDFKKILAFVRGALDGQSHSVQMQKISNQMRDCHKVIKATSDLARFIWNQSQDFLCASRGQGPQYLQSRDITFTKKIDALRFNARLRYSGQGEQLQWLPGIVAKVVDVNGNLVGIHRIFIQPDGLAKASVANPKMSLGRINRGAVHLDEPNSDTLAIAEGIETTLAVREMTKLPCWSALTASGLENVVIPEHIIHVQIFADLDRNQRGEVAAKKLATRLRADGKKVQIHLPPIEIPPDSKGVDWLDFYQKNRGAQWK